MTRRCGFNETKPLLAGLSSGREALGSLRVLDLVPSHMWGAIIPRQTGTKDGANAVYIPVLVRA
jgi:hypothetical protein